MKHLLFTFIFSVTFNMFAYSQDIRRESDYDFEARDKERDGKYEEALAIYMKALDIGYLDSGWIFNKIGNCCLKAKKFDEAYLWFTKGAEFCIPECMFTIGDMCMQGKGRAVDTLQAVSWYLRGVDIKPTLISNFEEVIEGTTFERDENILGLIEKYRKAATLYIQYNNAENEYLKERKSKALEYERKAFEYAEQGAELGIGYFVYQLGKRYKNKTDEEYKVRYNKAYSLFHQAIALGYTHSDVFLELGFACDLLRRKEECLEAYKTSMKYGNFGAAFTLALIYARDASPDYDLAAYYYKQSAILSGNPSINDKKIAEMKRKSSQSVNYVAEKPKQKKTLNIIGTVLSAFVQGANQYLGQSYSVPTNNYMLVTPSYTNTMPSFDAFTQQLENEYQRAKQAIPGLTYTQFLEARGRAINNMSSTYEGNSGSYSNTSSESSGYHSESNNSSHNKCMSCEVPGNGVCKSCHGSGLIDGMGLNRIPCPNCKNNVGKCGWCGGTGKRY